MVKTQKNLFVLMFSLIIGLSACRKEEALIPSRSNNSLNNNNSNNINAIKKNANGVITDSEISVSVLPARDSSLINRAEPGIHGRKNSNSIIGGGKGNDDSNGGDRIIGGGKGNDDSNGGDRIIGGGKGNDDSNAGDRIISVSPVQLSNNGRKIINNTSLDTNSDPSTDSGDKDSKGTKKSLSTSIGK